MSSTDNVTMYIGGEAIVMNRAQAKAFVAQLTHVWKPGDHYTFRDAEDVTIYGVVLAREKVLTRSELRTMPPLPNGYHYVRAYSTYEPEGEIVEVPEDEMLSIPAEEFEAARAKGWAS